MLFIKNWNKASLDKSSNSIVAKYKSKINTLTDKTDALRKLLGELYDEALILNERIKIDKQAIQEDLNDTADDLRETCGNSSWGQDEIKRVQDLLDRAEEDIGDIKTDIEITTGCLGVCQSGDSGDSGDSCGYNQLPVTPCKDGICLIGNTCNEDASSAFDKDGNCLYDNKVGDCILLNKVGDCFRDNKDGDCSSDNDAGDCSSDNEVGDCSYDNKVSDCSLENEVGDCVVIVNGEFNCQGDESKVEEWTIEELEDLCGARFDSAADACGPVFVNCFNSSECNGATWGADIGCGAGQGCGTCDTIDSACDSICDSSQKPACGTCDTNDGSCTGSCYSGDGDDCSGGCYKSDCGTCYGGTFIPDICDDGPTCDTCHGGVFIPCGADYTIHSDEGGED